jgi:hypothetical protein
MSRADLLALTPQSLASLANLGLVKRATRDIEEGTGPLLSEEPDGTVTGNFPDGTVARLLPGKPLKECPCSCNALAVCRHRVGVALAYKAWHHDNVATPSARLAPKPVESWSPAEIDDATLERALGKARMDAARAALRGGVVVTVLRGATPTKDGSAPLPTALLPACTVRFLVPRDPAYAKCDCRDAASGCAHVVVAVWAFREAEGRDGDEVVVSLGGAVTRNDEPSLALASDAMRELLQTGISSLPPGFLLRLVPLRATFERLGHVWPLMAVMDLERMLEAHAARSSLYSSAEAAQMVGELTARLQASQSPRSELPPRFILGSDVAAVTQLDHLRLVSLGARIGADGRARFADVFLADPDSAMVLVLGKRWDFAEGTEPEDGPVLARRQLAARTSLFALAGGQIVTKVAKRRANRTIELGTSRAAMTSVTPQRGEWEALPSPILIRDLAAHEAWLHTRAPRSLRPRLLAEDVHVIAISQVCEIMYVAAEQELRARVLDESGASLWLRLAHRRAAPHAIDAAAEALRGKVRFVSGALLRTSRGFSMEPLAIAADTLVVPDVAGAPDSPLDVARVTATAQKEPLSDLLHRAESLLAELLHVGLDAAGAAIFQRVDALGNELEDAGLTGLARRFRRLLESLRLRSDARAQAWLSAHIRLSLALDAA